MLTVRSEMGKREILGTKVAAVAAYAVLVAPVVFRNSGQVVQNTKIYLGSHQSGRSFPVFQLLLSLSIPFISGV